MSKAKFSVNEILPGIFVIFYFLPSIDQALFHCVEFPTVCSVEGITAHISHNGCQVGTSVLPGSLLGMPPSHSGPCV